jgi:hypothetical protein
MVITATNASDKPAAQPVERIGAVGPSVRPEQRDTAAHTDHHGEHCENRALGEVSLLQPTADADTHDQGTAQDHLHAGKRPGTQRCRVHREPRQLTERANQPERLAKQQQDQPRPASRARRARCRLPVLECHAGAVQHRRERCEQYGDHQIDVMDAAQSFTWR